MGLLAGDSQAWIGWHCYRGQAPSHILTWFRQQVFGQLG